MLSRVRGCHSLRFTWWESTFERGTCNCSMLENAFDERLTIVFIQRLQATRQHKIRAVAGSPEPVLGWRESGDKGADQLFSYP